MEEEKDFFIDFDWTNFLKERRMYLKKLTKHNQIGGAGSAGTSKDLPSDSGFQSDLAKPHSSVDKAI